MKLWLDDTRTPPDDSWTWAKSVDEAIAILTDCFVTEASLDHDLGVLHAAEHHAAVAEGLLVPDIDLLPEDPLAPTGYDLCLWMAEHSIWPKEVVRVHSANSVGAERMCGIVNRYGPYEQTCRWTPNWR